MNLFHLYSLSQQAILRRAMPHPRADEGPVVDMDPDLVLLKIVTDPQPEYDSLTQRLLPTEQIDLDAAECRTVWAVEEIPEAEREPQFKRWPDVEHFLMEFTMEEMALIGLSTDPTVAALRFLLSGWRSAVHANDPRVIQGLDALVAAGILTPERRAVIVG